MRVIKRYDNRKLYDTQTSKTVNLGEIADFIREGEEVQVIDSKGKDITPKILGQIFLQENVETKQLMFNKFVLQGLIQESQNMESIIKKFLLGGIGLASMTREKLDELVNELIKRGELSEDQRAKFVKEMMNRSKNSEDPPSEEASKAQRIAELEAKIAALQAELDDTKKDEAS